MKHVRRLISLLLILVILLFAACSSSTSKYEERSPESMPAQDVTGPVDGSGDGGRAESPYEKMIERYSIEMETQNFEASVDKIHAAMKAQNAYQDSSTQWNGSERDSAQSRNLAMVLRVEKAKTQALLEQLRDSAHVISESLSKENITSTYRDRESRKNMLVAKEARLTALLEKAETMEDLITVESALSETIAERESIEAELRGMDEQVDYQTVSLTLREVRSLSDVEDTRTNFGTRVTNALRGTFRVFVTVMEELVIRLIYAIPFLLLCAGLFFLFRPLWSKMKKRKSELQKRKGDSETDSSSTKES